QPAYLAEHFPDATWNTGLIRRIIMVYASEAPKMRLFLEDRNAARTKGKMLQRLGQISLLYGKMKWTVDAAEHIDNWQWEGGPPTPGHSKLQSYNASRTEFAAKLSMISAISRTADLVIELDDVKRAISWLLEAESHMPDIFRAMQGKSDAAVID